MYGDFSVSNLHKSHKTIRYIVDCKKFSFITLVDNFIFFA